MLAVIFEVEPKPGRMENYLRLAAELRPELEKIDGFVEIERFASRHRRGRVLSLSLWRDETAVACWRNFGAHRAAQQQGRSQIFAGYRLRVGEIAADLEVATGPTVTITEVAPPGGSAAAEPDPALPFAPPTQGVAEREWFESLYNRGKLLLLANWRDGSAAAGWRPVAAGRECPQRRVRITRDYGMFDRAAAPPLLLPPGQAGECRKGSNAEEG